MATDQKLASGGSRGGAERHRSTGSVSDFASRPRTRPSGGEPGERRHQGRDPQGRRAHRPARRRIRIQHGHVPPGRDHRARRSGAYLIFGRGSSNNYTSATSTGSTAGRATRERLCGPRPRPSGAATTCRTPCRWAATTPRGSATRPPTSRSRLRLAWDCWPGWSGRSCPAAASAATRFDDPGRRPRPGTPRRSCVESGTKPGRARSNLFVFDTQGAGEADGRGAGEESGIWRRPVSSPGGRRHRLRHLHARSGRQRLRAGTRAPSASRATRPSEIIGQHFSALLHRRGQRGRPARARARRPPRARGPVRARGLAGAQGRHAVSGRTSCIDADPRRRRRADRLRQDHPRHHRAAGGRAALRESEQQFRLLVQGVHRLRHLHARSRTARHATGTPARSGSRATRPTRSSASISRASTPRRTARPACPQRALRDRAREGRFEAEGWRVRKDGTPFLGARRHRPDPRRRRRAPRLRQDHARHHRAQRSAGGARARRARPCSSRRRWRRSASSPAASRTISTTCSRSCAASRHAEARDRASERRPQALDAIIERRRARRRAHQPAARLRQAASR